MMFYLKTLLFALILALLLLPRGVFSQNTAAAADTTKRLRIETAELVEYFEKNGRTMQKLSGNVRLRQDSTLVFSDVAILDGDDAILSGRVVMEQGDSLNVFADSAHYFGATRLSDLFGDIVLENNKQKLFTKQLQYDLANKIATYHNGALLTNGKSQLTSKHGYYYVQQKEVFFRTDVLVTDPEFTLRSDTLVYNTETDMVFFVAPTLISQKESRIYTEGGFYDIENNFAEFDLNPQYERDGQRGRAQKMRYNGVSKEYILEGEASIAEPDRLVRADVIRHNAETEKTVLVGNAYARDSTQETSGQEIRYDARNKRYQLFGRARVADPPNIIEADSLDFNDLLGSGVALGNVWWQDTASDVSILAYRMDYNKLTEYLNAYGSAGAKGPAGRPLMKTLIEGDTLYLAADTLTTFKPDSASEARQLLAHANVKIFKSNLQVSCDSLTFSSADSIFWFYKIKNLPIIWSDTSQFSADTIRMRLKDKKLDRIWLRQNALVVNSGDERFFNQIQGRHCTAFFREEQIREMFVEGNAQAVYYALDDKRAYLGVNETQCSEMRLYFNDNQVEGIRFYTEPAGKFTPMQQAGEDTRKLEGFFWEKPRRPRRIADLF